MEEEYFSTRADYFVMGLMCESSAMAASLVLNEVSREMCDAGHDTYIHPKTEEQMREVLRNPANQMVYIGIYDNFDVAGIVAEMGYFGIDEGATRGASCPQLPHFNADNIPNEDISYINSVCVDSKFRGRGFFQRMDAFLEQRSERRFSVAMVDTINYKSFGHFLDQGFFLIQKTQDPADGGDIMYVVKDRERNLNASGPGISLPVDCKGYNEKISCLIDSGFVGCEFDQATKSIIFREGQNVLDHFGCGRSSGVALDAKTDLSAETMACV